MRQVKENLEMLLLGLIADSPKHGYELKKGIHELVGHFYTVSDGMLYPLLKSLEENSYLVKSVEPARNLNRYVYSIADKGKERLRILLTKPLKASGAGDMFDFYLKLALFSHLTPWERIEVTQTQLAALKESLKRFDNRLDKAVRNQYHAELLLRTKEHMDIELAWLEELLRNEKQLFLKDNQV